MEQWNALKKQEKTRMERKRESKYKEEKSKSNFIRGFVFFLFGVYHSLTLIFSFCVCVFATFRKRKKTPRFLVSLFFLRYTLVVPLQRCKRKYERRETLQCTTKRRVRCI